MKRPTWIRAARYGPDSGRFLGAIRDGRRLEWHCHHSGPQGQGGHETINLAVDCARQELHSPAPSPNAIKNRLDQVPAYQRLPREQRELILIAVMAGDAFILDRGLQDPTLIHRRDLWPRP